MTKTTKILISAIAAAVVLCALIIAVSVGIKNKDNKLETTIDPNFSSSSSIENPWQSNPTDEPSVTELQTLDKLIIGKWMDSANMSGYEFFSNGKVVVTYVNLTIPFIELPINGTATGTYALTDNNLTVNFSIYSKTITKRFSASATENELTLKDLEDGDVGIYMKIAPGDEPTSYTNPNNPTSVSDDLVGSWVNGDSSIKYNFSADSTFSVSYFNAKDSSISSSKLNGTFNGIYMTQGNGLTVQFMMNDKKITQSFTYTVSSNSMSLADSKGDTTLFVRGGTSFTPYYSSEDLLGSWKDSTGSVGYAFNDGGIVEMTYVNFTIPVINMPVNGKYKGTYQVNGNELTIRYSVGGKSIVDTYSFAVNGNSLVLTNTESGKVTSYMK